jgi:RimJ/RimL family protein N-acetyltransferase
MMRRRANPTVPEWLRRLRTAPLRTRRLVIRPPRRGDDRLIYPAVRESMKELAPWLIWATEAYDAKTCRAFVRDAMRDYAAGRGYALLMFTRGGAFVGGTGFHVRGASARYYEVGYWCRSALAGHGYTTEAVKALLRLAFAQRDVHRIEIRCDPRNRASERVICKCGLEKEGRLRKIVRHHDGRLCDHLVFAKVR